MSARAARRAPAVRTERMRADDLEVEVTRKRMRNMYLRVRVEEPQVRVSCPLTTADREILRFVRAKRPWIEAKLAELSSSPTAHAAAATPEEQALWRAHVAARVPALMAKWEPVMGVRAASLTYRNMSTRWGSCQPRTGRVCINTRLALYPPECLEYVVVHELCHLHVSGHGPAFRALMDRFLPDWRERRALLR